MAIWSLFEPFNSADIRVVDTSQWKQHNTKDHVIIHRNIQCCIYNVGQPQDGENMKWINNINGQLNWKAKDGDSMQQNINIITVCEENSTWTDTPEQSESSDWFWQGLFGNVC